MGKKLYIIGAADQEREISMSDDKTTSVFCPRPSCVECRGTGRDAYGFICWCVFPRDRDARYELRSNG